jgi:diacylglycerol kinase
MKNKKLSDSFKNAFNGLKEAIARERNMRVHLAAILLCVILGIIFCLDVLRWSILFIAIGLVMVAELFNTAVENLVDMITDEYSQKARAVKDIAAGAVLVAAVVAVILGILVFIRPVLSLFGLIMK